MHAIYHTDVNLLHVDMITAVALLAMEIIFPSPHSADSTVFAMILLLAEVIFEKVAFQASVVPKLSSAFHASFPDRLASRAHRTNQFHYGLPIKGVPLFWIWFPFSVLVIVAVPTPIRLSTARGDKHTTSLIMLASIRFWCFRRSCFLPSRNGIPTVLHHRRFVPERKSV